MAWRHSGFTRASALGPIAAFLDSQGGSISRVLDDVDVPYAVLESPDMPVPLPVQFRLLERAARDIGDPFFGARLGRSVRIENLSAFGTWVSEATSVGDAIERSNRGLNALLQTGTVLALTCRAGRAHWSIEFLDPGGNGKYQNELLGLSYLIDVVRCIVGRSWTPEWVRTTSTRVRQTAVLEQIFEANVSTGHQVPSIVFPTNWLTATRPTRPTRPLGVRASDRGRARLAHEPQIPNGDDSVGSIMAVTALALLDGYPRIDWVAETLCMTRRSVQRRLGEQGRTFSSLVEDLIRDRSKLALAANALSITEIALRFGYADPAHFSRAFKRWTGVSPSVYRREVGALELPYTKGDK